MGEGTELKRKRVYENPWIAVDHSEVLNPNGGEGIYGVVRFKNLAIGIIPVDESGNTYLVQQERFPLEGRATWEIIEGGGPLHQAAELSAHRELQEEAGLKCSQLELIQEMDLSNSATDERAMIFLARDLSRVPNSPDATEKLVVEKFSLAEAYQMVASGAIRDSLSVAGLLKLQLMGF